MKVLKKIMSLDYFPHILPEECNLENGIGITGISKI